MDHKILARLFSTGFCFFVLAASPILAQRNALLQVETDPEKERATFQVAPGFQVNLFAADPILAKPIQMAWDSKGRLWVACSETYPQIKPGQTANDKIVVLEDTDGDGKADKTTVFAEGLLIPTGIEPDGNGVYVADSTELVYLQDTDGDGKADKRTVVLSGFGTEDTHHLLHTIRFGPDCRLYFNQSIYIHSHLETPHGPKRLGGGGTWAMRTKSLELDILMRGLVNAWGLCWDDNGQVFETDGAGGEGINYIFQGGWYFTAVGARRTFPGLNPGSPKYCGLERITGNHLPEGWNGALITNDFRGHRVCGYRLSEDGAGYQAKESVELIRSSHPAFRPIDVRQGPDGAIYLADWFNPIIQHGEVDFRDPRRDKTHGRIWRVSPTGKAARPKPNLNQMSDAELVKALGSDLEWTRHQARMVMRDREPTGLLRELATLEKGAGDVLLMQIQWARLALQDHSVDLIQKLLQSSTPAIRAGALRALSWAKVSEEKRWEILQSAMKDASSKVRLEVIRSLGSIQTLESLKGALGFLAGGVDRFEDYALWLTVNDLKDQWGPITAKGDLSGFDSKALVYAMKATNDPALSAAVRGLAEKTSDPKLACGILEVLADVGEPQDVAMVWTRIGLFSKNPDLANRLLTVLATAGPRVRGKVGTLDIKVIQAYLDDPTTRVAAVGIVGAYRLEALRASLTQWAKDATQPVALRSIAVDSLVGLGGVQTTGLLEELSKRPADPLAKSALFASANLDATKAAPGILGYLAKSQNSADHAKVAQIYGGKKGNTDILAKALEKATLPKDGARLLLRELSNIPGTEKLRDAVKKSAKLDASTRNGSPEEVQKLVALAKAAGDPARGEAVFRRANLQCIKCHAIGSAGGQVGPELGSIGGSAQPDYIVESFLLPQKAVKENYHTTVATTKDGKIFAGIKVKLDDRELVLRNAENQLIVIRRSEIEEIGMGQSLMPAGLVEELTDGELADLVRFLSDLGKDPKWSLPRRNWVRSLRVLLQSPLSGEMMSHSGPVAFSRKPDEPGLIWQTIVPKVSGAIPLNEVKPIYGFRSGAKILRADFEVSVAGEFVLTIDAPGELQVWVAGEKVAINGKPFPLGQGKVTFILTETGERLGELPQVLLTEAPNNPGRVRSIAP